MVSNRLKYAVLNSSRGQRLFLCTSLNFLPYWEWIVSFYWQSRTKSNRTNFRSSHNSWYDRIGKKSIILFIRHWNGFSCLFLADLFWRSCSFLFFREIEFFKAAILGCYIFIVNSIMILRRLFYRLCWANLADSY